MKKLRRNMKKLAVLNLATTILVLGSCSKEESSMSTSKNQNHYAKDVENLNIPYFNSMEELERNVEVANSFSTTDSLVQYENTNGIQSIGRLADVFYEANIPTDSNNVNGILLWQTHQDLLDTTHFDGNEICIEPKWFRSPYRYVANENGMFAVGESVFKLFKEGPVSTHINNAENLLAMTESDLPTADTSIYHRPLPCYTSTSEHPDCAYKLKVKNTPVSYNDRLFIELRTTFLYYIFTDIFNDTRYITRANTKVKIYNRHKWAGIWWISKHTYTGSGDVTIHRYVGNSNYVSLPTYSFNKTKKRTSLTINVRKEDVSDIGFSEMLFTPSKYYHYLSYNIAASFPGHATEHLIH